MKNMALRNQVKDLFASGMTVAQVSEVTGYSCQYIRLLRGHLGRFPHGFTAPPRKTGPRHRWKYKQEADYLGTVLTLDKWSHGKWTMLTIRQILVDAGFNRLPTSTINTILKAIGWEKAWRKRQ